MAYGIFRKVTTLEFFQHHFAKSGHGDGLLMTGQFISTFRHPPLHYLTRSVRRTSGFVLADYTSRMCRARTLGRDHTVIFVPSNLLNVKPSNGSLKVVRWSRSMLMATASPSSRDWNPSDRQCTAAISRPKATLLATLFSSPPTVISPASEPVYGSNDWPSSAATIGLGITKLSSKKAFSKVTPAPATEPCASG